MTFPQTREGQTLVDSLRGSTSVSTYRIDPGTWLTYPLGSMCRDICGIYSYSIPDAAKAQDEIVRRVVERHGSGATIEVLRIVGQGKVKKPKREHLGR